MIAGGPNNIEDGLVFYFDTLNEKSYRGEPTTNKYINSDFSNGTSNWQFASWDGGNYSYTTQTVLGPFGENINSLLITRIGSVSYAHFHQGNGGKFTTGNTYTISAYVKGSGTLICTYQSGFSGGTPSITLNPNSWQRISYTISCSTNDNYPYFAAENVSYVYFALAQCEEKSHATPFTTGTRSVTGSLFDTVGRTTIDLTNATYDSNANLYFNGSSGYAILPSSVGAFGTGNFTINLWWKSGGAQSNYTALIEQGFTGSPSNGAWAFKVKGGSNDFNFTYYNNGISDNNSGISPNDGFWHNLTAIRTATNVSLYIDTNSVLNFSLPLNYSFGEGSSVYVGYNPRDAAYANGNIDLLQIYRKSISLAEMKQIYNATKGRYGL